MHRQCFLPVTYWYDKTHLCSTQAYKECFKRIGRYLHRSADADEVGEVGGCVGEDDEQKLTAYQRKKLEKNRFHFIEDVFFNVED